MRKFLTFHCVLNHRIGFFVQQHLEWQRYLCNVVLVLRLPSVWKMPKSQKDSLPPVWDLLEPKLSRLTVA